MYDSIHLTNVRQKLVAQSLAFAGTAHQSGNIHKFHDRRRCLCRIVHFGQRIQPRIRHRRHAHVGINRTERIVRSRGCAGLGQAIEQRAFSYIGQTYDA